MAVRPGIHIAILLILGGLPRAVRPQTPAQPRAPRPGQEPIAATRDPAGSPSRPLLPPAGAWRLPAVPLESPSAALGGISDRPETLEQAWTAALAVDQRLEAKRWGVSSAKESLHLARAQRWPIVALEGSYTVRSAEPAFRFHNEGIPLPTNVFGYAQDENAAFRARVDLPLYTSGRIGHGIDAAAAEVTSAELELEDSTSELKMRVAEDYVGVLQAQRDLEVAQSNVRSLDAHAHDAEMLFKHDRVPANDLLAVQVALSDARQRAIRAANRLDAGRAAYNRRLGRPLTCPVRIAERPVETVEADVQSLTVRALRNRPAIARLAVQVQALRHQADSLRARNRLQFTLRGEYALEENRFRTPEGIAGLGVGVSWNAFDGGRNRYEAAALSRRADGLRCLQADLESMIALQVRRAWLDVQETRQRLTVTAQAIQQAEENLRVAGKRYSLEKATSTEVRDAETLRTQTYRNHNNATYDAVLAVLCLRHATGDLK